MIWNKFYFVYIRGDILELMVKLCDVELVLSLDFYG